MIADFFDSCGASIMRADDSFYYYVKFAVGRDFHDRLSKICQQYAKDIKVERRILLEFLCENFKTDI